LAARTALNDQKVATALGSRKSLAPADALAHPGRRLAPDVWFDFRDARPGRCGRPVRVLLGLGGPRVLAAYWSGRQRGPYDHSQTRSFAPVPSMTRNCKKEHVNEQRLAPTG
jgi:hypothetical protein